MDSSSVVQKAESFRPSSKRFIISPSGSVPPSISSTSFSSFWSAPSNVSFSSIERN